MISALPGCRINGVLVVLVQQQLCLTAAKLNGELCQVKVRLMLGGCQVDVR